jgi:hypothetical protein
MKPTLKQIAISIADRLGGALLISLGLRWIALVRRTLRQWRTAA